MSYASRPDIFPLDGGCSCGLIRYRLHLPPLVVHACHCTACQRETGSAFAINAVIESAHVSLLPPAAPRVPGTRTVPDGCPAGPQLPGSPSQTPSQTPAQESPAAPVPVPTPTESHDAQVFHRCPRCFAALWSYYGPSAPREAVRYLRVGTLDRAWEVDPDAHIFVKSKRDFVGLADGKPQYDALYPPAEVYRPDATARLEALVDKMNREG